MINQRQILCLWGFMGTGKSTVGALVAERAGAPFIDLDARIEREAGKPITEIFRDEGQAAFRALERAELRKALDENARGVRVVALGGGALVDVASRELALARAFVVTLTASLDVITRRTSEDATRPLLGDRGGMEELLRARSAAYNTAHECVKTDDRTPAEIAAYILKRWAPSPM